MTQNRFVIILSALTILLILGAGCTSLFTGGNATSPEPTAGDLPAASYKVTLHQPDALSAYIHTDTDVYNIGEVVEFTVTNDGSRTLDCAGDPPAFSVKSQGINGAWGTRMGKDTPDAAKKSTLAPGASTQTYRFITDGWAPGRYRIVHDCGVVREIILKQTPVMVTTPGEDLSTNVTLNTTIAVPDHDAGGSSGTAPGNTTVSHPFSTPALPSTSSRTAIPGILYAGDDGILWSAPDGYL
jgi:hypothetical protein